MSKIDKVNPLLNPFVKEAKALALRSKKMDEQINDRMHYIIASIFNLFKKKGAYWYYYGAEEGEQGDLWKHYEEDCISVVMDNCPGEDMVIILNDGDEWDLQDSIPTRWLFEDFEEELIQGKKKYDAKQAQLLVEKAAKEIQDAETTKQLIKAAKSKLSKAELAALKKVI